MTVCHLWLCNPNGRILWVACQLILKVELLFGCRLMILTILKSLHFKYSGYTVSNEQSSNMNFQQFTRRLIFRILILKVVKLWEEKTKQQNIIFTWVFISISGPRKFMKTNFNKIYHCTVIRKLQHRKWAYDLNVGGG